MNTHMRKENKSTFPNFVELKSSTPDVAISCPVCGEIAVDAAACDCCGGLSIDRDGRCQHVLFVCGCGSDDFELVYAHPRMANALQALENSHPKPLQLASKLDLDSERAMVMSVSTPIKDQNSKSGLAIVVGIEFPPENGEEASATIS
jgi:hypothetical protein